MLLAGLVIFSFSGCVKDPKVVVEKAQKLQAEGKYEAAIALLEKEAKEFPEKSMNAVALADAHLQYGKSIMNNAELHPVEKYKHALAEYRKVLSYDPANAEAKKGKDSIEAIYIRIGMPIPQ